ncbi:MAG: hypothetical protein K9K66_15705 [Desulfarculaceae bacterium]|nr:hypothetical protein [Desulfarculaceae bacterium]MCF8073578.1 hypothetical protein [Desulfarculaceae bacterium]MCF8103100.1 hypothetical protein [Desulfarculaceae bacterium]MCF8115706.1 hypothetical protein [Desulfarculaceae bacterium]
MRPLMRLSVLLCVLLLAVPALAEPPTACGLLTPAQVGSALGLAVNPGKPNGPNPMGQSMCFFAGKGTRVAGYAQLTLTLPPPKLRKNLPASRLFAGARSHTPEAQPVGGLGDQAFWGGTGAKMGAGLHVLTGDYYLIVDTATGDKAKDLAAAKQLAGLALKKLK